MISLDTANCIKGKLNTVLNEMAENPSLFVVHPGTDFIRNTPLNFKNTMTALLSMGGQSLGKELYNFMKQDGKTVSVSAFVQQRAKLLPEALNFAFHEFNAQTMDDFDKQRYRGYKLYAVDGSDIVFATNPLSEAYMKTQEYNMYHMNALYDLLNHTYRDLIIEPNPAYSEPRACWQMAERSLCNDKCIITADRGYGGANLFEHLNRISGVEYLIRVKNNLFKEFRHLPVCEFDTTITFELRGTQTNADKEFFATGEAKWVATESTKGKHKKKVTWDFESPYRMTIRVVRIHIGKGYRLDDYETIVTSLPKKAFPLAEIKKLYHMRWGIESSFRELKYALGLINFHARKDEFIKQEIYAHFLMYNFCERIAMNVVIVQDKLHKWTYVINHTMAVHICLDFYRHRGKEPPPIDPEAEIAKNILPVRDNRRDRRKIKTKEAVYFLYRVA